MNDSYNVVKWLAYGVGAVSAVVALLLFKPGAAEAAILGGKAAALGTVVAMGVGFVSVWAYSRFMKKP
jgi:cellobiose-specific phosphotransferase system component IIC